MLSAPGLRVAGPSRFPRKSSALPRDVAYAPHQRRVEGLSMGLFSWLRRHVTRLATPKGCEFAVIHKAFFRDYKTLYEFESKFRASAVGRYPHEIGILQGPWKGRKLATCVQNMRTLRKTVGPHNRGLLIRSSATCHGPVAFACTPTIPMMKLLPSNLRRERRRRKANCVGWWRF